MNTRLGFLRNLCANSLFLDNIHVQVIDPGYTKAMPWQSFKSGPDAMGDEEDASITADSIKVGKSVQIEKMSLGEHQTGPPDYLTESDLITLMEKHSIGWSTICIACKD